MATTIEPEVSEQRPSRGEPAARGSTEFRPGPNGGKRNKIFAGLGIVLLVLVAGGVRKWIWSRTHVSSDNSQVDGHILPVLPKVGGYVLSIRVEENQVVKQGDTIVVLDDKDYTAKLQQADADLAVALATVSSRQRVGQADAAVRQAQANADRAHADLDRIQPLVEQGVVSRQQLDGAVTTARAADAALASAQAALLGADARVAAARASRDWSALQLSYTRILAPTSGVVSKKSVEVGQLVQAGQPLMTVVPLSDVWVTANLKETETTHVVPGDTVQFTVDAYPGCHFGGRVESLSPATGARFSLLPPDNATGNFTKVVQRIPVRIRPVASIDCQGRSLRPGMSVVATITTK
jgi:membrane fusion protein (multidrug efflux system)